MSKSSLWKQDEQVLLEAALRQFGKDWAKVSNHVGTKDKKQCKKRSENFCVTLRGLRDKNQLTPSDEELLRILEMQLSKPWTEELDE